MLTGIRLIAWSMRGISPGQLPGTTSADRKPAVLRYSDMVETYMASRPTHQTSQGLQFQPLSRPGFRQVRYQTARSFNISDKKDDMHQSIPAPILIAGLAPAGTDIVLTADGFEC